MPRSLAVTFAAGALALASIGCGGEEAVSRVIPKDRPDVPEVLPELNQLRKAASAQKYRHACQDEDLSEVC
jgi:hypothetical protein